MYVKRIQVSNIRAVGNFDLKFGSHEYPGWHVILGENGSGKSTLIRSIALALAGPKEAVALRQEWHLWLREKKPSNKIQVTYEACAEDLFPQGRRITKQMDVVLEIKATEGILSNAGAIVSVSSGVKNAERSIWGPAAGWFSASFGPFRRFSGGDQAFDRLFYSNPRLAPHLSAFGEDVALTEGLRWLRELWVKQLESPDRHSKLLQFLIDFLNDSGLLPNDTKISEIRSDQVILTDSAGAQVRVEQMSDGYRSVLSMIFEILRQMTKSYGAEEVMKSLWESDNKCVSLSGVVCIDEVDAHLHPTWQKEIGPWFTKCFPKVQFIVTTHSPIICRNATSVWKLFSNDEGEQVSVRVEGVTLNRLIYGSILDAYGTEMFGRNIAVSDGSKELLSELAVLNRRSLRSNLSEADQIRMNELRGMLPTNSSSIQNT